MSSADFDDSAVGGIPGGSVGGRFGLASSFSLSEADEAEYLAEQEQQQQTSTESAQQTSAPLPPVTFTSSTNVVPTVQQKQKSFQVPTTDITYYEVQ